MRHAPGIPLAKLAWNRPDMGPYWFHYTTRPAAARIVQEQVYRVLGARTPAGLYVTSIHPGQLDDEELLNRIFDGTREIERVQAAVVLHDDPALPLNRIGGSAWVYQAPQGTDIPLDGIVVGGAFKQGGLWHYDRSLWDF